MIWLLSITARRTNILLHITTTTSNIFLVYNDYSIRIVLYYIIVATILSKISRASNHTIIVRIRCVIIVIVIKNGIVLLLTTSYAIVPPRPRQHHAPPRGTSNKRHNHPTHPEDHNAVGSAHRSSDSRMI